MGWRPADGRYPPTGIAVMRIVDDKVAEFRVSSDRATIIQ
jgi:hypothetical protein